MAVFALTIAVFVAQVGVVGLAHSAPVKVDIDLNQRFQTMNGWEATMNLADSPQNPEWAAYHEQILERAINGIGINRLRLEIRSGAETKRDWNRAFIAGEISHKDWEPYRYPVENDNDDPNVIDWSGFSFDELDWHVEENVLPLMALAEARGEKLWINLCYVSFISGWNAHHDPEEYAEFVLATYIHLNEKYEFVPDSWEVILEPDLKRDMWTGKMIGEALVASAKRLREEGFEPAFVVPSVTNMDNAVRYIEEIAKVPNAMDDVIELSYHRYKGANKKNLRDIAQLAQEHGVGASMLEFWFGHANSDVLYQDLTLGDNVAWQSRSLFGIFNPPPAQKLDAHLQVRRDMRYNRQYFRDIRLGATRVAAHSSHPSDVKAVAFQNVDGSVTVVVDVNENTDIEFSALQPGQYRIYYIADQKYDEIEGGKTVEKSGVLELNMPGAGLMTITSRAN
jgi:hypothetical protein